MIQVKCGGCSKGYAVPDQFAGKKMRCKQCAAVIAIPEAESPASPPPSPPSAEAEEASPPAPRPAVGKPGAPRFGKKGFPGKKPLGAAGGKPGGGAAARPGIPKRSFGAKKFGASKLSAKAKAPAEADDDAAMAEAGLEEGAPPEKKGAKQKKLLVIGGCVVLALALAAAAYVYFFMDDTGTRPAKKPGKPVATSSVTDDSKGTEAPGKAPTETPTETADVVEPPTEGGGAAVSDALSIVPAEANFLARIAFGRMANLQGANDKLEEFITDEAVMEFLNEAEFDPRAHLQTLWVAGKFSVDTAAQEDPPGLAIIEGTFEKEKVIAALQKRSLIASGAPRKLGSLEVYEARSEGGEPFGFFTFLASDKILVGSDAFFNSAMKLLEGGESVRSSKALADLTHDFAADKLGWMAFAFSKEMQDDMATRSKEMEKAGQPPIPTMDGACLEFNTLPDGTGILLDLQVRCVSPEEAQKAMGWASLVTLLAKQFVPKEAQPALTGLKASLDETTVRVLLPITDEQLKLLSAAPLPIPGMTPPPGEGEESEEEGMEEEAGDGTEEGTAEETEATTPEEAGDAGADAAPAAEEPAAEEPAAEEPAAEEPAAEE